MTKKHILQYINWDLLIYIAMYNLCNRPTSVYAITAKHLLIIWDHGHPPHVNHRKHSFPKIEHKKECLSAHMITF